MSKDIRRISMWSGPRNVSTAFMYAFHHRGDCHVIDEPYYAYYLKKTGVDHPGRLDILNQQETNPEQITQDLLNKEYGKNLLFMKNMPHHMVDIDLDFVGQFKNFFLIREPRAMIASYIQKIPEVCMADLGLDLQYRLFENLRDQGHSVPVIDSYDLLRAPESTLRLLCGHLDIPFSGGMLSWPAGAITADGVWARYWYANVHQSTGFSEPRAPGSTDIPAHLEPLVAECEQYYQQMKKNTLQG